MAINGAYICDIKSDQTISGKKTFIKEVAAPAFTLEKGKRLRVAADGAIEINSVVRAHRFEGAFVGDASGLKNFSVKNMNADEIQSSVSIVGSDYLLAQKILDGDGELKKLRLNDLFALIPSKNGVYYNFITNGENKGSGCQIYKRRDSSGRSQTLCFRTLTSGPNIELLQNENEIEVRLKENISTSELNISTSFVAPRVKKGDIQKPINGMLIYNTADDRFYGYAKDRWIALHKA
jgi:hypothetical protein